MFSIHQIIKPRKTYQQNHGRPRGRTRPNTAFADSDNAFLISTTQCNWHKNWLLCFFKIWIVLNNNKKIQLIYNMSCKTKICPVRVGRRSGFIPVMFHYEVIGAGNFPTFDYVRFPSWILILLTNYIFLTFLFKLIMWNNFSD